MKTEEASKKVMRNKLSEKLGRIAAVFLVGIACGVVGYIGGVHYAENSVTDNQANNLSTVTNNDAVDVLSVSDSLSLTKLTALCPALPPEILEMAMMFVETPEQRATASRLTESRRYKSSTGSNWIKQAPNPFLTEEQATMRAAEEAMEKRK